MEEVRSRHHAHDDLAMFPNLSGMDSLKLGLEESLALTCTSVRACNNMIESDLWLSAVGWREGVSVRLRHHAGNRSSIIDDVPRKYH